jgi:phthalate 4,5-cis-dihydrodiol dehydrogenase
VLVSCDLADLRLTPLGVEVHSPQGRQFIAAQLPTVPRAEVIDELWGVSRLGHATRHDGLWSRATLEVCLAILAGEAHPENLRYQVPTRD